MRLYTKINSFVKENNSNLLENINIHKTYIKELGEIKIPNPDYGDLKLSVFPFENNGKWVKLPESFKMWEESFNKILKTIPLQEGANTHYVTIDTKFFTTDDFLRREGVHVDGNFCVDPNFKSLNEDYKSSWGGIEPSPKPSWAGMIPKNKKYDKDIEELDYENENDKDLDYDDNIKMNFKASWGGIEPSPKPSWAGLRLNPDFKYFEAKEDNSHVKMDWVLPYKLTIPVGDYISHKKGGILTVSTEVGCQAWQGTFKGEVLGEGSYINMEDQLTDDKKILFEKNKLYFMTSNTPHETLIIPKGTRRTFMRITLNHNLNNESFINL